MEDKMSSVKRVYVEKKPAFAVQAKELRSEIQGYLAYDNGLAIGWCNANERLSYYRTGEFDLRDVPEDEVYTNCSGPGEVKAIVCFEIAPEYRGKGVATQLLARVCEDAKAEGYRYVEAYPVQDGGYLGMAFTGPVHMYEKAGHVFAGDNAVRFNKEVVEFLNAHLDAETMDPAA